MNAVVTLRAARAEDAAVIARLAAQLGYPASADDISGRLVRISSRARHRVLVAQARDAVIGWVHVLSDEHLESGEFAEIAGLVVDDASRGTGVGRMLLGAAEAWARGGGFASIRVRSNVIRAEAHAFYEREGFALRKTQKVFEKLL